MNIKFYKVVFGVMFLTFVTVNSLLKPKSGISAPAMKWLDSGKENLIAILQTL